MTDYHRFVAYIYEYVKGKKHHNAGFAKVEQRNGTCRIQIHIQKVSVMDGSLESFVIVREKEKERIFLLGKGMIQGNVFEQRFVTLQEALSGTSYRFEQVCGIYVRSQNGRKWMTVFDDEAIEIEKLQEEKEESVEETEVNVQEKKESVEKTEIDAEEKEEGVGEIEVSVEEDEKNVDEIVKVLEQKDNMERSCGKCRSESERRWRRATAHYVHMQAVWDDNIEDAIRIRPSDLNILWQKGVRQGSNSFLMHGFYRFHHLILGKKRDGGYILGVPAFYQEKNMAQMFGFTEFRKAYHVQQAEISEETYGYWCKDLEE